MTDQQPTPTFSSQPRWLRFVVLGILGLFALVILLVIIATCSTAAEPEVMAVPPGPPLVAKADPSIRGLARLGDVLTVDVIEANAWKDADYPVSAAMRIQAVAGALKAGAADGAGAKTIQLAVSTPATDRLGRESELVLMVITFPVADLVAADFDGLSYGRTLNLATDISFGPQGAKALAAYCATERGQTQSPAFCTLADRNARS